ncbi:MAG TPA: hypothetical protein VFX20_18130 [Steroidobacteraceae bacterium]|nr:hypothetical protein [Steroidobacteraceae bacterium]
MRLMLLTAALFAADADFGASAPADPQSVQAPAPQTEPPPPVDNDHVAEGSTPFSAPSSSSSSSDSAADTGSGEQTALGARVAALEAQVKALEADSDHAPGPQSGALAFDSGPAPMGAPVIVRKGETVTPGIVVEEDAGHGITVQLFRGDHGVHATHHVRRVVADGTGDGWFYPWERETEPK